MKGDDLTQVKNIGRARMKLLNSQGITTIQQLCDMPLEKLEQVKSLGQHYAKLIKQSVNDLCAEKAESSGKEAREISPGEAQKIDKIDRNLNAELTKTVKYLKTAREKLKPIQKKKHIKLFVDLKKRSNKLKTRIMALSRTHADLSEKKKKKIIKKAAAMNSKLKCVGKSKKGKAMKMIANEIESFSKTIRQ